MACTIEATVGHASGNSYATIAEGNTYHDTHLYASAWTDTDTTSKCKALQMATRLLDAWFDWHGSIAGNTQALRWPRVGAFDPDGYLEASDAIPVRIKNGTIELARQLLISNRTADNDTAVQGVKSLTAGSVSLTFESVSSKPIPDAVMSFVSPYGTLRSRSGSGSIKVYRG